MTTPGAPKDQPPPRDQQHEPGPSALKDLPMEWLPSALDWSETGRPESVQKIVEAARKAFNNNIRWYLDQKGSKKRFAQALRFTALGATILAALSPIVTPPLRELVASHVPTTTDYSAVAPTLFLAVAGAAVLSDRFWGHSTGWMRYIATYLKLIDIASKWDHEVAELLRAAESPMKADTAKAILERTCAALNEAREATVNETRVWAAEFESSFTLLGGPANGGGSPKKP